MDETSRRKLYIFVIEAGIRLEAKSQTICTASILTYRALRKNHNKELCPYTLACACLLLAGKAEEDEHVRPRDVLNVANSVLHPERPLLEIGEEMWRLRASIARMEYIALRLLKFRVDIENPHNYLSLYISSLMHWCPHEFKRQHVGFIAHVLLRDAHVDPEWVFSHNPQTIAVVCLSLAMRITQVSIGVKWYKIFVSSMRESKLCRLEKELMRILIPK